VLTDADVPGVWAGLGLAGILDMHVHFLPEPVMRKVWAFFDDAGEHYGMAWPITYRLPSQDRLERLRLLGVRRFPSLVYPHKAGMAAWLNDWSLEFAREVPAVWPTFTFFPEPDAPDYVADALARGAQIAKVHVQVGGFDPRDPQLDDVWGMCADAAVPVVTHCGDGPVPGPWTGVGPISDVLARHPSLTLVVAHLGMPRYGDFLDLAERYERVHLDTTMAFTDFVESGSPFPAADRSRLRVLQERICFGSDFPNIPHTFAHQVEALMRLEMGDDWMRDVLWHNAARLLPAQVSWG
jgi:predicted TIM-barrel fold metal-dependent hydrolase